MKHTAHYERHSILWNIQHIMKHTAYYETHSILWNTQHIMKHTAYYETYSILWNTQRIMKHTAYYETRNILWNTQHIIKHTAYYETRNILWDTQHIMKHAAYYAQFTVPLMIKTHNKYNFKICFGSDRKGQFMQIYFLQIRNLLTVSGNYYFSRQTTSVFQTLHICGRYIYHLFYINNISWPPMYLCISLRSEENVTHYINT